MSLQELLPFVVVGLVSGSVYGLAGLGLVLTYRTSGVFNFAHGAIAAAAAYAFYALHVEHGVAWPIAAAVTVAVFAIGGGLAMERLTRGLAGASPVAVVVLTVGLTLAIGGLLLVVYGDATRYFPAFLPTSGFQLAGVLVGWNQLIAFTIGLAGAAGLYAVLRYSRVGTGMRAVVESPTLVSLTGERPVTISRTAWVVGTALAAVSGLLLAPTLGLDATLLTLLVVQSFGACAIGLFKSLPLTYAGGLVVGVSAALATKYVTVTPWSGLPAAVPFVVLIVVLVAVPSAKLPASPSRSLVSERHRRSPATVAAALTVAIVGLAAVPFVVGTYLPIWIVALIYSIVFGSLALLVWTSGQISLCHLSFVALGATTIAHLTGAGVPWLVALVLAGLAVVPVGALVAVPAMRVSGIYLALVTLGFGILMQNVVFQSGLMFGVRTFVEAHRPVLGVVDGTSDTWFYFVVLAVALAVGAFLVAVQRSRLGRLLRAMSEAPRMLATSGLEVTVTKLIAFCTSAFLAGLAGALLVTQFGAMSGQAFGPVQSLVLVAVLGISGTGLLRSPLLAAALMTVVPGYVRGFDQNVMLLAFGIAAVVAGLALAHRSALDGWVARAASDTADRVERGPVRERLAGLVPTRAGRGSRPAPVR